ncbi:MAG TPA: TetR/AcrR family transcriptional regulator [Spirochaetota bacterium]|nr:TetR/AcrR family transcriptional regulator [Spirochaetota bacterium]HOK93119.1 TetR/AcrR family transcriptional regulator [Spirochaetota bacterium]HON16175.1 TetR/AcrR family transcriptional regulator [Spirochaetota bacterium]HPD77901.1 TetR/AcrR family transcriptional regulator [Spirochaetota bacterium]HRS63751.1 TetR/AcrR family transcriptional regulator [Spirochaetota bacterium]
MDTSIKRKHILNSLKQLLDKYSYSYISMQDVADEAGISKGGLRYYFPTKESLFLGLLEDFFTGIEEEHMNMVNSYAEGGDRALLSTLFNIENFVLNQKNIKVFINLILYGLEKPEMMKPISAFFRKHLEIYKKVIEQAKTDLPKIDKSEFDLQFLARITQIILLSTGLLEAIDPIGMEPSKLARYVLSLFAEK